MSKFDLIIKNGLVILDSGEVKVDIAVKQGKIAAIGYDLGEANKIIDAEGLIVSPGMVDVHVHITDPGGVRADWEGYVTGTRSCAKGGVTTFVEMPLNQLPATVNADSIAKKYQAGKDKLHVDVASYGGLVPHNINGGIQELDQAGVAAYKCFMTTCGDPNIEGDFDKADDYTLYEGMKQIAKTGKILAIHAENGTIASGLAKAARARGETTLAQYVATRPVFTEVEAIRRAIYLAKITGCRIHICHVACPEGVEEVSKARAEGVDVTCETCLHYLYFVTDELDKIGMSAKCSPPIRDQAAKEGLWQQIFSGALLTVVSDHSPCSPGLKEKTDAFEAWGGISGVQNNVDIFFDEGVQKRGLSLKAFADLIAKKPAERFNLPTKGSIAIGKDADLVLIKPNSSYVLQAADLEYRNKFSPYVGRTINAQIAQTYLRGQLIYSLENGVVDKPLGEYIYR
ncbi:allantoinase [Orbus hercynius]|uniref:Allantoinase n=1 Tax=Orbus hercynius TaxID=593135 RepID=A0A495RJI2_9GAMM|nr:allantoinase AllB [Orbus hercynius]RKS87464.1 allantoinase [Orbus hercynius]